MKKIKCASYCSLSRYCRRHLAFRGNQKPGYLNKPLDSSYTVYFYGGKICYNNEYIKLGPHTIYIDGTLSDELAASYNYVYNYFKKAVEANVFQHETSDEPMCILLAIWVYLVDDPDDPAIRSSDELVVLSISCAYLRMEGLSKNSRNVVIADNRGQQTGANGNWTCLRIVGAPE